MDSGNEFVVVDGDEIRGYNEEGVLPQTQDTMVAIQRWLRHTDYMSAGNEYMKHLSASVPGTGEWLRNSETFQQWHNSEDRGCIWIKGVPGSGKSVFAAATAKELADAERAPVLFFFFRQIVAMNHEPCYLVRDWLSQVLSYSPSLQLKLKILMDKADIDSVRLDELWDELCMALEGLPRVYCFADALDEMNDGNDQFIRQLEELGQRRPGSIKVFLTSRPIPHIESILRSPKILTGRLEQTMIYPDIVKYVETRMDELDRRLRSDKHKAVKDAICDRAQGLFLHARLMTDNLIEGLVEGRIVEENLPTSLERLPRSLRSLYTSMLAEHSARSGISQALQLTILQWVTHSTRPLRLLELGAIVSFMRKDSSLKVGKELVRESCGRLLEILEDETVSVIHHSFTEFLRDATREGSSEQQDSKFPVINSDPAHRMLTTICLQYLETCPIPKETFENVHATNSEDSYYSSDDGSLDRRRNLAQILKELRFVNPLFDYAVENWDLHVAKLHVKDRDIFAALDAFLVVGNPGFTTWISTKWPSRRHMRMSPIHVAAYLGLIDYVRYLVASGSRTDDRDGEIRTPLSYASERGHDSVVKLLIDQGANPDPNDQFIMRPLAYAAKENRLEVVKILLGEGVHPSQPKPDANAYNENTGRKLKKNISPLFYACSQGHVRIISEFLMYLDSDDLCRALYWTARQSATEAMAMIIDAGAPVDVLVAGRTALFTASDEAKEEPMKLLLERGANPNFHCQLNGDDYVSDDEDREVEHGDGTGRGPTPLHALAGYTNWRTLSWVNKKRLSRCLQLLVKAGVDFEAQDKDGNTPLHTASKFNGEDDMFSTGSSLRFEQMVDLLLKHGANPSAVNNTGHTPLHLVTTFTPRKAELLMQHGAHLDSVCNHGRTPLHEWIMRYGSKSNRFFSSDFLEKTDILYRFLDLTVDCNVGDADGNTPLHLAVGSTARDGKHEIIKALVKAGADLNKKNKAGFSPILLMTNYLEDRDGVLWHSLISAGIDLNAKDPAGRTVLFTMMGKYNFKWASLTKFLELGCSASVRDHRGRTILHHAIQNKAPPHVIHDLIEAGADAMLPDHLGNTLLHTAARSDCGQDILGVLVGLGLSVEAQNHVGQTPIHVAVSNHAEWAALLKHSDDVKRSINMPDFSGACPVHYAATIDEQRVFGLLQAGADPTAVTFDGSSALHAAARARRCNVIALLLSVYQRMGKLEQFIDLKDTRHITALLYACRSGLPESVRCLLQNGADPLLKVPYNRTSLSMLAEFEEENLLYSTRTRGFDLEFDPVNGSLRLEAAGMLLSDRSRTWLGRAPCRVFEIFHMLVEAGVDLAAKYDRNGWSIMDVAMDKSCVEMIHELRRKGIQAKHGSSGETYRISGPEDAKILHQLHISRQFDNLEESEMLVRKFEKVLEQRDYALFKEFVSSGADLKKTTSLGKSGLETLVEWGYDWLLEYYKDEVKLFDDTGRTIDDEFNDRLENDELDRSSPPEPLLVVACKKELPSLNIIKLLVEKAGVDIHRHARGGFDMNGATALHWLAAGQFFWNIEALDYLIDAGADMEAVTKNGETPLMIAMGGEFPDGFWKEDTARVLLKKGANVNAMDGQGQTCLNRSKSHSILRMLIENGADITVGHPSPLSSAVMLNDLQIVQIYLEADADLNTYNRPTEESRSRPYVNVQHLEFTGQYPLNQAARPWTQNEDWQISAGSLTRLLLNHGANPFAAYEDGSTVLQDLVENDGLLDPFWGLPELNLEHRGNGGRTLLLSACYAGIPKPERNKRWDGIKAWPGGRPDYSMLLIERGAQIDATDDIGRNALHWLCSIPCDLDHRQKVVLKYLLGNAPHLTNQRDNEGYKPLHLAINHCSWWTIETIIEAGADPCEADVQGKTILHHLAPKLVGESKSAREAASRFTDFVSRGVSLEARDLTSGETAFFNFMGQDWEESSSSSNTDTYINHRAALSVFTNADVNIHARNDANQTVLHIVAKRNYKAEWVWGWQKTDMIECFKDLMALGLDPRAEDNQQRSAIDIAVAAGNNFITELFQENKAKAVVVPVYHGSDDDDDDDLMFTMSGEKSR